MRKTKIIATIGPATRSYEMLVELYKSGVNAFRLNFSHGTHADHLKVIEFATKLNEEYKANVAIIADLQGPKLRVGKIENNEIDLINGAFINVTTNSVLGTKDLIDVTYEKLAQDVKPGELILLDDGKIEIQVVKTNGKDLVKCKVINGGILSSNKGFNLPNTNTSVPSLTPKDREDLAFILTQPVNWIAISFVRNSKVIHELREIIFAHEHNGKIIAKIEKPEAINNIDSIIKASDAIMIARGDLGVEVAMEEMPIIQKKIIEKCIIAARPVIIATQVMESMLEMSRPSRAEITDVANGVLDGADCIMLSGETSVGKFPIKVIETIDKIVRRTEMETQIYHKNLFPNKDSKTFLSDAICYNACRISEDVNAKAVNGMTWSGYTAFLLASFRPRADIFIFTSNVPMINSFSIVWGVTAFYYDTFESTDQSINDSINILKKAGKINSGDIVVNTASMPITGRGRTNMIKINHVK